MNCRYLIVGSVTYAFKARDLLISRGIAAKIEKLRHVKKLGGCGYALKVASVSQNAALQILKSANVRVYDVIPCEDVTP